MVDPKEDGLLDIDTILASSAYVYLLSLLSLLHFQFIGIDQVHKASATSFTYQSVSKLLLVKYGQHLVKLSVSKIKC